MKRKLLFVVSLIVAVTMLFTACGQKSVENVTPTQSETKKEEPTKEEPKKEVVLTATTNLVGEWAKILEDMLKAYSVENPNVKIEFSAPGKEYGNILQIKMASNDMPDLFSTHGWSVIKYGNFVADLKDRPWASRIDPGFKPIISDSSGKIYTFAFDQDKSGPIYNVDVFKKYGVEVPKTFDEFMAVCETIKTKSNGEVTPIACAAENWEEAQFFDFFATALLISPKDNHEKQLLDGTFDWSKWDVLAQKWHEMYKKGYINKDMLTAKYNDNVKAIAEGKAAIGLYGPYFIDELKKVNPDIKADMMPIPSMVDGDTPTFAGGERSTIAAWKDSKHLDEALKVIDFCAKDDNVTKMCSFTKLPPVLKDVKFDAGELTGTYEKYKEIRTFPYFDRVYLPNGMWDVMCKNSQLIIGGKIDAKQFSENMKKEYLRLRTVKND